MLYIDDYLMKPATESPIMKRVSRTPAEKIAENIAAAVNNAKASNTTNGQNANSPTKTTSTTQRQTTKKNSFDDLFLEGFNSARDRDWREEQKSRMQKFGIGMPYESITQKKTPIQQPTTDKLTPEDEKAFLEGFNKYRNEDKVEQTKVEKARAAYADMQKHTPADTLRGMMNGNSYYSEKQEENGLRKTINKTSELLDLVPEIGSPFESTQYEYRDRNHTYLYNKYLKENMEDGVSMLREPLGRFGIAAKGSSDVFDANGNPAVNYILGLDTKYIDQDGKLQTSTIPQWVFNRDSIKQHNVEMIDKITDTLASRAGLEQKAALYNRAGILKAKQASKVDAVTTTLEKRLNAVDALSRKNKANKAIAEAAENVPKILNSDAMQLLKTGGKAASAIGDVLNVVELGMTAYGDYKEDGSIGKDTIKATAGVLGDIGGSALGAKIGATVFGAIGGVASGGVLAAPLAVLGGVVGGFIGGIWGEKMFEGTYDALYGLTT